MTPEVSEAIEASQRLLDRGDAGAAMRVLDRFGEHRSVDLQRGSIAAASVLMDGQDPAQAVSILTPHLENARALDLIGLAHYHSAITTGEHPLSEPVGECTAASRKAFDDPCWKADNTLHIGMIQQAQGSHDIAAVYLQDAYRMSEQCSPQRVLAARHLGFDARDRGDFDTALELLEESLELARLNTLTATLPESLIAIAELVEEARTDQAIKLLNEAVDVARTLKCRRPLALALAASGRVGVSSERLEEAMSLAAAIGDRRLLARLEDMV